MCRRQSPTRAPLKQCRQSKGRNQAGMAIGEIEPPRMKASDRGYHAEPEADARLAPARIAAIKALHHLALFVIRYAGSGICNPN
jgi:hypothetical protein